MSKIITICILTLFIFGCGDNEKPQLSVQTVKVLRVGFPPDENPSEIIRKNKPLMEYLRVKTGLEKIELIVPDNYTAAVEMMAEGKLDMVYFGGLTYVLAKQELDITPIVRGKVAGTSENFTYIVVRSDSGIDSLKQLNGKRFAFGDVASTSGHLIPHKALLDEKIDPKKDFAKLEYTGAHDKTALAVFNNKVDAGAMNSRKFPAMIKSGQLDEKKMKVLWKSAPFADYPWAVKTSLGPELISKLQSAFVTLQDKDMLNLLGVEGYSETKDGDFDNIRQAARELKFLKE